MDFFNIQVSLLSTVFAPPPSTSLLTRPPPPPPAAPLPPSSTESVAWVEGLKKARELSRRQKGGELSEANQLETLNDVSDVDRSSLSPPLASVSPNNIQTEDSIFVSSSNMFVNIYSLSNEFKLQKQVSGVFSKSSFKSSACCCRSCFSCLCFVP